MKTKYILTEIKKANKISIELFNYLKKLETSQYDKLLQINIVHICEINEILTNLEISIESDSDSRE